jgi:hypothetical protein
MQIKAGERGESEGAKYPGPGYIRFIFVLNEIRLLAHYPLIVVIDCKT